MTVVGNHNDNNGDRNDIGGDGYNVDGHDQRVGDTQLVDSVKQNLSRRVFNDDYWKDFQNNFWENRL